MTPTTIVIIKKVSIGILIVCYTFETIKKTNWTYIYTHSYTGLFVTLLF